VNRYSLVVEAAPNAMIVVGPDGLIRLVNAQAERLFGYPRAEMLGHPMEMLVPDRFRQSHRHQRDAFSVAPATRALDAGRNLTGLRKDGREIPVEIGLNPIDTADGPCVLASLIDLTERRKTEDRFQLVVEAAPNAMIMVCADGLMTLVNTQAEQLFGYSRAELLGRPIEMLVPARFRTGHSAHRGGYQAEPLARAMAADRELSALRRDGSEVPVEVGLNPIDAADGPCVLASIIDITERRSTMAQLRQALAEKTTLLKEVHHRVKNNLQVIGSLLSMQIECVAGDSSLRALQDAHSRVFAMSLIHEQIYQSDTLTDLDFGEYVERLSERLFSAYCVDESRVRLELSVEPILLAMHRAIPCGLILNELISNSLKHAFRDGRDGVIRIALHTTENGRVELAVADNGAGLPANFRLEERQSLGLQVVRTLINQLRASLQLVSGDEGTEFRFSWEPGTETQVL
jgi:PAS domain S-box-containing protein